MSVTFKKLDYSQPATGEVAEEDKWKHVSVEKSVSQSPMKSVHSYNAMKSELDDLKAKVAELEADLAKVEAKAKS